MAEEGESPICKKVLNFIIKHLEIQIASIGIQYITKGGIFLAGNFAEIASKRIKWDEIHHGFHFTI